MPDPAPVTVENVAQVEIVGKLPPHTEVKSPSTTTAEQDRTTASQRGINRVWELTQSFISVTVVLANMIVGTIQGLGLTTMKEHPPALSNTLFLVVGFYFSRTNHTKTGGVGATEGKER